jgi:hypothetical protein
MGKVIGEVQYAKFKTGARLTRREAMRAQCYECNGFEEGREDCRGISCPLYQFFPYRGRTPGESSKDKFEK